MMCNTATATYLLRFNGHSLLVIGESIHLGCHG